MLFFAVVHLSDFFYNFYFSQSKKPMMENDIEDSSGSDFDDDEDPDKIQVPGRQKNNIFFCVVT